MDHRTLIPGYRWLEENELVTINDRYYDDVTKDWIDVEVGSFWVGMEYDRVCPIAGLVQRKVKSEVQNNCMVHLLHTKSGRAGWKIIGPQRAGPKKCPGQIRGHSMEVE